MARSLGAVTRKVHLRAEIGGADRRYIDAGAALHIEGQDLGPATAITSRDREYQSVAAADVPRLVEDLLERSCIPVSLWTWSG